MNRNFHKSLATNLKVIGSKIKVTATYFVEEQGSTVKTT